VKNLLQRAQRKLERYGAANMAFALSLRAVNAVITLKILRAVYVEEPDREFLACPPGYRAAMLDATALRRAARQGGNELSPQFVEAALARGDQCLALCEGETIAAYGWYAAGPTPVGLPDLAVHFGREWIYMYKGFTHEAHRGRRLHAIGMTLALQHYRAAGCRGLVSYVEAENFDSLKSCFRMGYAVFGSVYIVKLLGRYFSWASPGCRRFAFRVGRVAPDAGAGLLFGKN
jgi:hypothetical protein